MTSSDLWIVQYLRAAPGRPFGAVRPRIYRLAAFSGEAVWGINTETDVLAQVNRPAEDGSGRIMNMRAYPDLVAAERAAAGIAAEMDAAEEAEERRRAEAAAARLAEQREKYPALIPLEDEPAEGDGGDGAAQVAQVRASFTVKSTRPDQ